jgi:hypothetical protein
MRNLETICVAVVLIGLLCAAGAPAARPPRPQRPLPAGMGLDEALEKQLADTLDRLAAGLKAEKLAFAEMDKQLDAARRLALQLWAKAQQKDKAPEPKTLEIPETVPVPVYAGTTAEQVRGRWREQLEYYVRTARGLLSGDRQSIVEWCGRAGFRRLARRARPMVECLREAARALAVLSRPAKVVHCGKGEQLFADDFSGGAGNWLKYGQCIARNEGDAFRMIDEKVRHPDAMMWTKQVFDGNFLAEFTFVPRSEGGRAGALFTICGLPKPGKTLAVCVGATMNTYNYGINGYHFSMHRGTTGLGNVRRVGPGLKMLTSGPDPCPKPGARHRVAVAKWGQTIFLIVDGKLIHSYFDGATYGPVLTKGHIGLRHWAGMDASYQDFRVYRLVARKAE